MKQDTCISWLGIGVTRLAFAILMLQITSAFASEGGRLNPPTNVVTVSADRLARACRAEEAGSFEDGVCLGYVLAVADIVNNGSVAGKEACTPPDTLHVELQTAAQHYFLHHPDYFSVLHSTL